MGMTGESAEAPEAQVRRREVSWEDPLISAAQALDLMARGERRSQPEIASRVRAR